MGSIHCFFCQGKECKYENWKLWTPDSKGHIGNNVAIEGLYSSWITPDILAMQRPSSRLLKEFNLVDVFVARNIRSIFNLQSIGEHASCGDGIEKSSGFSYLPEQFMDAGISYYNFGWTDMETPDVEMMMNIVDVMSFALENEKKISVHCHAGLGRTGLAIACYLIYSQGITANNAIAIVRGKRPLSVQTKKQVIFVQQFGSYLRKLQISFPGAVEKSFKVSMGFSSFSLDEILLHQRKYLKSFELRYLRYVPKVIHEVILRIIEICSKTQVDMHRFNYKDDDESGWYIALDAFIQFEGLGDTLDIKMRTIQEELNVSQWIVLSMETDVQFLVNLLLHWIITLKEPIISDQLLTDWSKSSPTVNQSAMTKEIFETLNYILKFFRAVPSISKTTLDQAIEKLTIYLTSHRSSLSRYLTVEPEIVILSNQAGYSLMESIKSFRSPVVDKSSSSLSSPQSVKQNAATLMSDSIKSLRAVQSSVVTSMNQSTTISSSIDAITAFRNQAVGIIAKSKDSIITSMEPMMANKQSTQELKPASSTLQTLNKTLPILRKPASSSISSLDNTDHQKEATIVNADKSVIHESLEDTQNEIGHSTTPAGFSAELAAQELPSNQSYPEVTQISDEITDIQDVLTTENEDITPPKKIIDQQSLVPKIAEIVKEDIKLSGVPEEVTPEIETFHKVFTEPVEVNAASYDIVQSVVDTDPQLDSKNLIDNESSKPLAHDHSPFTTSNETLSKTKTASILAHNTFSATGTSRIRPSTSMTFASPTESLSALLSYIYKGYSITSDGTSIRNSTKEPVDLLPREELEIITQEIAKQRSVIELNTPNETNEGEAIAVEFVKQNSELKI